MKTPDTPWYRLRVRLVALGWTPEYTDVPNGLRSPHNACMTIPEDINDGERRATMLKSLRLKRSGLRVRIEQGKDRDIQRQKDVLRDFQQLIDCITELGLG
jgi:hypothetical protein